VLVIDVSKPMAVPDVPKDQTESNSFGTFNVKIDGIFGIVLIVSFATPAEARKVRDLLENSLA
jgi:hypothetical protein